MRYIIPISGKDSLSTAIFQMRRQPHLPYEFLYNPTGMDLPEVDTWLTQVETYLHIHIERVGDDLESIMYEQKFYLRTRHAIAHGLPKSSQWKIG